MRTQQGTVFQSLRAIEGFLDEHPDKRTAAAATGAHQRLEDARASLDTRATDQTTATSKPGVSPSGNSVCARPSAVIT